MAQVWTMEPLRIGIRVLRTTVFTTHRKGACSNHQIEHLSFNGRNMWTEQAGSKCIRSFIMQPQQQLCLHALCMRPSMASRWGHLPSVTNLARYTSRNLPRVNCNNHKRAHMHGSKTSWGQSDSEKLLPSCIEGLTSSVSSA